MRGWQTASMWKDEWTLQRQCSTGQESIAHDMKRAVQEQRRDQMYVRLGMARVRVKLSRVNMVRRSSIDGPWGINKLVAVWVHSRRCNRSHTIRMQLVCARLVAEHQGLQLLLREARRVQRQVRTGNEPDLLQQRAVFWLALRKAQCWFGDGHRYRFDPPHLSVQLAVQLRDKQAVMIDMGPGIHPLLLSGVDCIISGKHTEEGTAGRFAD